MSYYLIEHSAKESEVGSTFPQSHVARHIIGVDDPMYLGKQGIGTPLSGEMVLPQPILHPEAKLTDLVSTVATWRLIISTKLKSILERHVDARQFQFLPISIHYVNAQYGYWMLNPVEFNMDAIDFATADIWVIGIGKAKIRKVQFLNATEFEQYSRELVSPETLCIFSFKFINNVNLDFIQVQRTSRGIVSYVSENLKNEITRAACTGIQFTPFPE
jgi:hypothetical protein